MSEPTSTLPEQVTASLSSASWPAALVSDAIQAAARHVGLPTAVPGARELPPPDGDARLDGWIDAATRRAGLQACQVFASVAELDALLAQASPALIRVAALESKPFIAIVGCRRRHVLALGPDLRVHRLRTADVLTAIRRPFEIPVEQDIDRVLSSMSLSPRMHRVARSAMISDRLSSARFRGCWILQLPPGAPAVQGLREIRLPHRLGLLVGAQLAQYALFVLSWMLLGRAVLSGSIDRGWLTGWLLLLISVIPLRLLASWHQGLAAITVGAWLRRRLLRGAFHINRQDIRAKGSGQLFGVVVESAAIDSLAVSGGLGTIFAVAELGLAFMVLWRGAGTLPIPLLACWTLVVTCFAWSHSRLQRLWTRERIGLTDDLIESMSGHRTRLVQERNEDRHRQEDVSLDRYVARGEKMDHSAVWLAALAPRGWLVVSLGSLTPALLEGASPTGMAISVGGILIAYRALQRLGAGLSGLTGAVIAAEEAAPLSRASEQHEPLPILHSTHSLRTAALADARSVVAEARDVSFRYRESGEPVLRGCNLTIHPRSRILLEGPSGSGKTTLASILAGLEEPTSGLLLMNGLDRAALGPAGWRTHAVMAPQAHDNYLIGGTLAFNLLMGKHWPPDSADLAEAEAVCRELGLGELLDRMPAGLQQVVGETGWQLSQGERTRVFLARALLQKPELLILDESFGALDPENVDRAVRCVTARASAVLAIAHP